MYKREYSSHYRASFLALSVELSVQCNPDSNLPPFQGMILPAAVGRGDYPFHASTESAGGGGGISGQLGHRLVVQLLFNVLSRGGLNPFVASI